MILSIKVHCIFKQVPYSDYLLCCIAQVIRFDNKKNYQKKHTLIDKYYFLYLLAVIFNNDSYKL